MASTIRDVARAVGVSTSTVSRALSGSPRISDETRRRVLAAAEELRYTPSSIARSLASSRTRNLGIVLPTGVHLLAENPFFIQAMAGIAGYAQEHGFHVMFAYATTASEELRLVKRYSSGRVVDGIVLVASREKDRCIEFLKKAGPPFVVLGHPDENEGVLWVDNDNRQATRRAVSHLVARGHRRIAFLGGPTDRSVSRDRLTGFVDGLRDAGLAPDEALVCRGGDFTYGSGLSCTATLLDRRAADPAPFTAIVTCDDLQALGALAAMQQRGVRDVALIGFNNIPVTAYTDPPLSTIDVNAEKLGLYAAKLLIDHLEGDRETLGHYIVKTSFVERASTARHAAPA